MNGISQYVTSIANYFRNVIQNATGMESDIYQLLAQDKVEKAIGLMDDNNTDVDNALDEYYPQKHKVMSLPDKPRKKGKPYEVCKLPRARQRYINEIELFFLLGSPIKWEKKEGSDDAYKLFLQFLQDTHFNSKMRTAKRLAGAETESAKLYRIYRNEQNEPQVQVVILARSNGYQLRTLFDQYGNLTAFAYGYKVKAANGRELQCWDIQTAKILYFCRKSATGWAVEALPNPTGKINAIYYKQPKAWEGVEPRIEREEMIDSKIGDTNNYFADPTLVATADAIQSLADPEAHAKVIQIQGGGHVDYLNPPSSSELRAQEKVNLNDSILFDTFTPDFSFDKLKGLGSLSGKAIRNAMQLGFIKRANREEIYGELVEREKNVILAVLKILYPQQAKAIDELKIAFSFSNPFGDDEQEQRTSISNLYTTGIISLQTAVSLLGITDTPEEEVALILAEKSQSNNQESQS